MAEVQIQEVRPWHEMLVDYDLLNPGATLREAAEFFGKTVAWISVVKRSDAFQDYRQRRMAEHNSLISGSVIDKVETLADVTVEAMLTKVEEERDKLSLESLRSTADTALRALGYRNGSRQGMNINAQGGQVNIIDKDTFREARKNLERVHQLNSDDIAAS